MNHELGTRALHENGINSKVADSVVADSNAVVRETLQAVCNIVFKVCVFAYQLLITASYVCDGCCCRNTVETMHVCVSTGACNSLACKSQPFASVPTACCCLARQASSMQ